MYISRVYLRINHNNGTSLLTIKYSKLKDRIEIILRELQLLVYVVLSHVSVKLHCI